MQVIINGENREVDGETLAAVLVDIELDGAVVATALNGAFVPARRRAEQPVAAGDRIEILAPMQGG